ncbi:hypothetical protein V2J09_019975 [Rumex salicifolius]
MVTIPILALRFCGPNLQPNRMGRVKIEIKQLNNTNGRQATYSKRKQGILKKAHELSILCDIDLVLLMFSPTGKAAICCGRQSIEEVIAKYARLPAQERVKRKLEGLQALKKTFLKSDHDVNIPEFDGSSTPTTKDLSDEVIQLQNRLSDVQERLSYLTNPDSVNDMEVLTKMEDSVKESIQQIQRQKEKVANQQFVRADSNNLLHNDIELPFQACEEPQFQDLSTWIPFDDMPHMTIPGELNLPSQRDVGISICQSFTGPFNYYNMCTREDTLNSVQPSQENNFGANLSQQAPLTLDGQYPYPCSFNMVGNDRSFQQLLGMEMKPNTIDYDIEGRFQQPPGSARNEPSTSHVSCGVSLFSDHLNSQKGARIPSPMAPSVYKTVGKDPNRTLYDLLNAPN